MCRAVFSHGDLAETTCVITTADAIDSTTSNETVILAGQPRSREIQFTAPN